ncbi:hypothetical protein E4U55_001560, partial [Claviceps digitariae]
MPHAKRSFGSQTWPLNVGRQCALGTNNVATSRVGAHVMVTTPAHRKLANNLDGHLRKSTRFRLPAPLDANANAM